MKFYIAILSSLMFIGITTEIRCPPNKYHFRNHKKCKKCPSCPAGTGLKPLCLRYITYSPDQSFHCIDCISGKTYKNGSWSGGCEGCSPTCASLDTNSVETVPCTPTHDRACECKPGNFLHPADGYCDQECCYCDQGDDGIYGMSIQKCIDDKMPPNKVCAPVRDDGRCIEAKTTPSLSYTTVMKPKRKPTKPTEATSTKPTEKTAKSTGKTTKPTQRPVVKPTWKPMTQPTKLPLTKPTGQPITKPRWKSASPPTPSLTEVTPTPFSFKTDSPGVLPDVEPWGKEKILMVVFVLLFILLLLIVLICFIIRLRNGEASPFPSNDHHLGNSEIQLPSKNETCVMFPRRRKASVSPENSEDPLLNDSSATNNNRSYSFIGNTENDLSVNRDNSPLLNPVYQDIDEILPHTRESPSRDAISSHTREGPSRGPFIKDLPYRHKKKIALYLDKRNMANWLDFGHCLAGENQQLKDDVTLCHQDYYGGGEISMEMFRCLCIKNGELLVMKIYNMAKYLERDDIVSYIESINATNKNFDGLAENKKQAICFKLDKRESGKNGWRDFAEKFGFTAHEIDAFGRCLQKPQRHSPTEHVMKLLEVAKPEMRLSEFQRASLEIGNGDLSAYLEEVAVDMESKVTV